MQDMPAKDAIAHDTAAQAGGAADDHQKPSTAIQPATHDSVPAPMTTADDVDLIEKEWVEHAKAVVRETRNDPYLQSKELQRLKAAYIGKRYQKDIKLKDE